MADARQLRRKTAQPRRRLSTEVQSRPRRSIIWGHSATYLSSGHRAKAWEPSLGTADAASSRSSYRVRNTSQAIATDSSELSLFTGVAALVRAKLQPILRARMAARNLGHHRRPERQCRVIHRRIIVADMRTTARGHRGRSYENSVRPRERLVASPVEIPCRADKPRMHPHPQHRR